MISSGDERLLQLSHQLIGTLNAAEVRALFYEWRFWARAAQLPPKGEWRVWLLMAGRGFGKTRTGAEWVRALATSQPHCEIGLIGATFDDVRHVMVDGPSGIVRISPPEEGARYYPCAIKFYGQTVPKHGYLLLIDPLNCGGLNFILFGQMKLPNGVIAKLGITR